MIVPDSVKKEWVTPPGKIEILSEDLQTTRTQLEEELQTTQTELKADLQTTRTQLESEKTENEITRLKLANAENRISILEQSLSSIISKLNI